ncbi:MAG: hypothetical protein R6U39_05880 [Candidatus Aegiribacteria sp.]
MTRAVQLLLALASTLVSSRSTVDLYSVFLSMEGDTLVTVMEFTGVQGSDRLLSRISRGFDPSTQAVRLETADMGTTAEDMHRVPAWSVDTLTGGGGWRRSLVTAFPNLREGMAVHYRVAVRDWSGNWSRGAWAVLSPRLKGIVPDSCVFSFSEGMMEGLEWSGEGYRMSSRGGAVSFTAADPSGELVVTPFTDCRGLSEFLLSEAESVLAEPFPPDLREAALQATSAGADGYAQSMRARSLLCNSISPERVMNGSRVNRCRGLQEILDSRKATPLEMAAVYTAVCRELGMEAIIVPAGGGNYGIPVPSGWNRYLVRITSSEGDSWFAEPSAYLSPASWIPGADTLSVILGGERAAMPSPGPSASRCRELWRVDALSGTFRLELDCSGWFDMSLRRRTAGLTEEEVALGLAEWCWLSGRTVVPDTLSHGDPFALDEAMALTAEGRLWEPVTGTDDLVEVLPALLWPGADSLEVTLERQWTISGASRAWPGEGADVRREGNLLVLTDSSGTSGPLPVLLKVLR